MELNLSELPELILNMNNTGWSRKQQFHYSKFLLRRVTKAPVVQKSIYLDHVTSVHTGTAVGDLLENMIVYKNELPEWPDLDSLPPGWIFATSDSGFVNQALFYNGFF